MKKNKWFMMGTLAMMLAFGLVLFGCENDADDGDDNSGIELPAAKGVNALSGKTYIDWGTKIEFSKTNEDATSGTYEVFSVKWVKKEDDNWEPILENDKYVYVKTETGNYTWDDTKKTVTTAPEKIAPQNSDGGYEALQDKAGYRTAMQAEMDKYIKKYGEEFVNAMLQGQGFYSITEAINSSVAEAFKNVTRNYDFSTDNKALFLDEVLPENKGTNELANQKYNETTGDRGMCAFTAKNCTYTRSGDSSPKTYIYAYDSTAKRVYLKIPTDGREVQYNNQKSNTTNTGNFASADEYNAAQVNGQYGRLEERRYDLKEKTLQ
jgi:hypothetical protein